MKGRPPKTTKMKPKKTSTDKGTSDIVSSSATEELNAVSGRNFTTASSCDVSSSPVTAKRGRRKTGQTQETCLTSTPVHSPSTDVLSNISNSPHSVKEVELGDTKITTRPKTSEVDSSCSKSKSQGRPKRGRATLTRNGGRRASNEQLQTCSKTNGPPAKRRRGRTRKNEICNLKGETTTPSCERPRPRFELPESPEQDDSLLSSDLSIELSHYEEQLPSLPFQEDEESDEEEEELPSFLMQADRKLPSIREGVFVWHKFRNYPFWPALVKSVNRKQKKASIVFLEYSSIQKKKGFAVALKSLKPFDCEEANELVCKAKEKFDATITWCLELKTDYEFKIACGSFSGSFIEYFDHDMSYPVRRKYPQAESERLTLGSDVMTEEPCDDLKEDSFSEQQEEVGRSSKRLLPDRTHAAHNRANEKLVHFIVKQRMVEGHLLAVIRGQQQSRWLRSFLSASRRRVVNIYLEDDQQLDQVYWYLNELYATAVGSASCQDEVKSMERVPFVLDVLLPEAIINAIAGVDQVSVKKAEEKYLKGRCISNRERQEFDLMLERQMKKKF
uniref:Si:dkey-57k2.7 n=1 Tax=Amphiprion percula TaxID=161767 RepID=A0A3P8S0R2_AMPPE